MFFLPVLISLIFVSHNLASLHANHLERASVSIPPSCHWAGSTQPSGVGKGQVVLVKLDSAVDADLDLAASQLENFLKTILFDGRQIFLSISLDRSKKNLVEIKVELKPGININWEKKLNKPNVVGVSLYRQRLGSSPLNTFSMA